MNKSIDRPGPQEYLELFETDRRGARILEDLILRFSQPPVVAGGIDAVLKTYLRIGQTEVVNYIVRQINKANNVQVNEEENDNA
jgi:hypothetical protein